MDSFSMPLPLDASYVYPQLLVWNIDSHVFMFTEKPAYQDPLEALPPSCLGIQPVSFPYGAL